MTFEVFRAISSSRRSLFNPREDCCASRFSSLEVAIEIIHIHEHAVDYPRNSRPFPCLLADDAMVFRTMVVRCWRGNHNQSIACLHLAVRKPSVRSYDAYYLPKSKRICEPFQSCDPIFVGDHWDDGY